MRPWGWRSSPPVRPATSRAAPGLLAGARHTRRNSQSSPAGQSRVRHHPPAAAQTRRPDQRDYQPYPHRLRRRMSRGGSVPQPRQRALLPTAIAICAGAPFTPNSRNVQRLTHLPDQNAVHPATGRCVRYASRCQSVTPPAALMNKSG
jgi:hypothetical protein